MHKSLYQIFKRTLAGTFVETSYNELQKQFQFLYLIRTLAT